MSKLLEQINTIPRTTIKLVDATSRIGDGLHGTPIYDDRGEYYFINGNNLDNGYISIKKDTKKVGESEFTKHKKDLNEHTLFLSINGTIGNLARYRGEKCILGKSAAYINIKDGYDSNYFYYVLLDDRFKKHITNNASGSTIKNVSLEQLREYEINIPDPQTQKKIASILGAYDAKIENNNKIIKNLETTAQTIFNEWFVNFKFPGHEKVKMVDSEMGEIPEGWGILKMKDLFTFVKGKKPKEISEIKKKGFLQQILIDSFEGGKKLFADKEGMVVAGDEDLLMVMDGASSGRIEFGISGVVGSTLSKLHLKRPMRTILYLYLKSKEKDIKENTTGSAIPHTDKEKVYNYDIVLPNDFVFYEDRLFKFVEHIKILKEENISLKSQKDFLLVKLI